MGRRRLSRMSSAIGAHPERDPPRDVDCSRLALPGLHHAGLRPQPDRPADSDPDDHRHCVTAILMLSSLLPAAFVFSDAPMGRQTNDHSWLGKGETPEQTWFCMARSDAAHCAAQRKPYCGIPGAKIDDEAGAAPWLCACEIVPTACKALLAQRTDLGTCGANTFEEEVSSGDQRPRGSRALSWFAPCAGECDSVPGRQPDQFIDRWQADSLQRPPHCCWPPAQRSASQRWACSNPVVSAPMTTVPAAAGLTGKLTPSLVSAARTGGRATSERDPRVGLISGPRLSR